MGQIVEAFHDATTDHAAKHALEKAQQVLSGDDGLEIGAAARKHVEAVVSADSKLVVGIIKRFTVDGDQHPADALRPLLHDKLVGEDSFDDVITWAQGWVKQTIDRFVEQGQPARVIKQDFHQALLKVPLRDRCSFGRFTWLISQALTVTYVVGEHRLYLERNCRLPESGPQETAESRGACQFQGAEQSAGFGPAVEPRRK